MNLITPAPSVGYEVLTNYLGGSSMTPSDLLCIQEIREEAACQT